MRNVTLAALIVVSYACRTVSSVPGGEVHAVIGDDVCAVLLTIDAQMHDQGGQPVPGVEVWRIDRRHIQGKVLRLGTTADDGHLKAPDCYMGSTEYRFWHPSEEPVLLKFMVVRQGYAAEYVQVSPPTAEVIAGGGTLGVPPGEPFEWSQVKTKVPPPSYGIPLDIMLRRVP